jgi:cobalamin 5'-phosphate synthase/cobalamin synthase
MPAASFRAGVAAVTFLTRVPFGRAIAVDGSDVARGVVFFPLVGAGIGAVTGVIAILLHERLSSLLAAGLAVAVALVLTGALHIDALADTVDALGASSRERALEIMRDSRVGSFGAAAVAICLIVKVAAIAQLLDRSGALRGLVAAAALARAASPPLASLLPYPRVAGGPGSVLVGVHRAAAAAAALAGCAIAVAVAGLTGVVLIGAVVASTVVLGLLFRAWLGGVTGDSLGAATEVGETLALVVAAALA